MNAVVTRRVSAGWLTTFTLVWLAIWMTQLTPIQLLLPLQLDTGAEGGEWISGVVFSGLVLSVGGLVALIAGPLAGALSDRTVSRLGRRRPWAIGGALVAATALAAMGGMHGPWEIGGMWALVSLGIAVLSAALTAMIADQLPVTQRGSASAAVSSAQALGLILGVGVVVLLGLGIVESYLLLAALIGALGVGGAIFLPDPLPKEPVTSVRREMGQRFASLRDRDFVWLLFSRLTVNIGNALGTSLFLFFLIYGLGVPNEDAEDSLLLLTVVYTLFVVTASYLVGFLSDRYGGRRTYTVVAALVLSASGIIIWISPTYVATICAAAVMGAGYGAYMTVSLAFSTELLPNERDHARDMGFVNVAANLGQLLGPLIGAGLVALVGGFWLLYVSCALVSMLGAVMTLAVRRR